MHKSRLTLTCFAIGTLVVIATTLLYLFGSARPVSVPFRCAPSPAFALEWKLPALTAPEHQQLQEILREKFTFFEKGDSAYVFLSEDKKYTLHFLKAPRPCRSALLSIIPLSFNPYYQARLLKKQKQRQLMHACRQAYTQLKEETALVYVHLNSTAGVHGSVTVFDAQGNSYDIAVDSLCFYVQKTAHFLYSRLSELMHQEDEEGAKRVVSSVFALADHLAQKKMISADPFGRNSLGLVDDRAVQINFFMLQVVERLEDALHVDLEQMVQPLRAWLSVHYPSLIPHFEECILVYNK